MAHFAAPLADHPEYAMKAFQDEIQHSGGIVEFVKGRHGGIVPQFTHSAPWPVALQGVFASMDGVPIASASLLGDATPPEASILAIIVSDQHGFFGRRCPACHTYFRTTCAFTKLACPYCTHVGDSAGFLTDNQKQFVSFFCRTLMEATTEDREIKIDLDSLTTALSSNRPDWAYSEEKQQRVFCCSRCRVQYDILGDYARCPYCLQANARAVFEEQLAAVENRLGPPVANGAVESGLLGQALSALEAMAKFWQPTLVQMVGVTGRAEVERMSFQRLSQSRDILQRTCGFDLYANVSTNDQALLTTMLGRRHVLTHNGGRVDQRYLASTGDQTVRLNQVLSVTAEEIKQLLPLLRRVAENLINGAEKGPARPSPATSPPPL